MIKGTFIARTADGLVLCESKKEAKQTEKYPEAYEQALKLLKTMAGQPAKQSVKVGPEHMFQYG